jgi:hypothetical protein
MLLLEKKAPPGNNNSKTAENQMGRPREMESAHLLHALKKSGSPESRPPNQSRSEKKEWRKTWRIPKISRYSLRFERGRPVLRQLEKDIYIRGSTAMDVLLEDDKEGMLEWYADAGGWVKMARRVLCEMLQESLEASVSTEEHDTRLDDLEFIKTAWDLAETQPRGETVDSTAMNIYSRTRQAWGKALHLVEDIRYNRRVGEGRLVHFRDLSIFSFLKDVDVFGIPSAAAKIYVAHLVHAWASPYFPVARKAARETWQALLTVFMTRFYEPAKGVLMDILDRSPNSMMEVCAQNDLKWSSETRMKMQKSHVSRFLNDAGL